MTNTLRGILLISFLCISIGGLNAQCPTPILTYDSANTLCDDAALEMTASITLPPGCAISNFNGYLWNGPGLSGTSGSSNMLSVAPSADAGDYSVRIQIEDDGTGTGCSCLGFTSFSNSITVNPTAEAPSAIDQFVCVGAQATFTATPDDPAIGGDFYWYSDAALTNLAFVGNPFTTPNINTNTSYYLTEVANGCESVPEEVVVSILTQNSPVVNPGNPVNICTGDDVTLTATPAPGNTISGDFYWYADATGNNLLYLGQNFTTPSLFADISYWVREIDGDCVTDMTQVDIVVTTLAAPTVSPLNPSICEGDNSILTALGGNGDFHWYSDAAGDNLIFVGNPYTTPNLNTSTDYWVNEVDGLCESELTLVTITTDIVIDPPSVLDETICENEQVTLTVTNGNVGDVFEWFDSSTADNLLFVGSAFETPSLSATTTYWLRRLEGSCYSVLEDVIVTVNPNPAPPVTTGDNLCPNVQAELSASGAGDLNWYSESVGGTLLFTGPNYTTPNPLFQTTLYYVEAENPITGCVSDRVVVEATVLPATTPPAAPSEVEVCFGEIVTLSATGTGIAANEIRWYEAATGGTPISTSVMLPATATYTTPQMFTTTNYYVAEYDQSSACESNRTFVRVTVIPEPTAPFVNDTTICTGEMVALEAPGTGLYHWYDALSGGNLLFTGLLFNTPELDVTTSYYITLEENGCESPREEVIVNVEDNPATPDVAGNSGICAGETLNLSTTAVATTYTWTGPNGFNSPLQNPSISNAQEADHQGAYTLIVTNLAGCVSEVATTWIDIHAIPQTPTLLNNSALCIGGDLILSTDEIADASYIWTDPNGAMDTSTTPSLTIPITSMNQAGTYEVYVEVNGCASPAGTTIVELLEIPSAPMVSNTGPSCLGTDLTIEAEAIANAHYYWTGPNGFTSTEQVINIFGVENDDEGTYTLEVMVDGCTSLPASTFVQIDSFPEIVPLSAVYSNGPLCEGDTLRFFAPHLNNISYEWSGPNGIILTGHEPLIPDVVETDHQGNYYLVMMDSVSGCTSPTFVTTVEINKTLEWFQADNNGPNCEHTDIQLFASEVPGATYSWAGPNGFTSAEQNPILDSVKLDEAGFYSVEVISDQGCISFASGETEVIVDPSPIISAGEDKVIEEGFSGILQGSGGITYQWTPDEFLDNPYVPNPTVLQPLDTITYHLIGYNGYQCSDTDSMTVYVVPQLDLGHVVEGIAGIITPNGDGVNDTWVVEYIQNIKDYEIIVLDRGGSNVFYSNNYDNSWDGTYRDKKLPDGTYWYLIKTPELEYKGAILLKR